tara:strand:+ start:68 stop:451 length:384 start_codon:yes stop_codon:yes gene_type:complete
MENNSLLMIVLAFLVGYKCSGMMKHMCGGGLVEGLVDMPYKKGVGVKYYPGGKWGTRNLKNACQDVQGGPGAQDDCIEGLFCRYPAYGLTQNDGRGVCVKNVPKPNDLCPSFNTNKKTGVVTCNNIK